MFINLIRVMLIIVIKYYKNNTYIIKTLKKALNIGIFLISLIQVSFIILMIEGNNENRTNQATFYFKYSTIHIYIYIL